MTNTETPEQIIEEVEEHLAEEGFVADPYHSEQLIHQEEIVRLVWLDGGDLAEFRVIRYEDSFEGPIVASMRGAGLAVGEAVAAILGFTLG
jgi:hypothetical protein